jgi:ABC-type methionine transport system permease subunit
MRFGAWNVRSLYGAGSFTAAARELATYKLYLVGVQKVRWDRGGTVGAGGLGAVAPSQGFWRQL